MTHPFFEAPRFPWARDEAKTLEVELRRAIKTRQTIVGVFERAGGDVGDLDASLPPNDLWHRVIELLAEARLTEALCDELERLRTVAPGSDLRLAIEAIRSAKPAIERREFGRVVVLDRVDLRGHIAEVEPDDALAGVIIVRGDPKTGRSHGRHLFQQAAADQDAATVYVFAGLIATVDELVTQIRAALRGGAGDISPRGDSTEDAWYRSVCVDLQTLAARNEQRLWVVVDDLGVGPDGAPLLDPQVRAFCDQFALSMLNPAFRQWFRLLLVDYPAGPVPTRWRSEIWREDVTDATDIDEDDVTGFLLDWAAARAAIAQVDLEQFAREIIGEADGEPETGAVALPRLQRLNESLARRLRSLDGATS